MKRLMLIPLLLVLPLISGCALGSASAAYSVRAGSSDDLNSKCRQEIIADAVRQSKEYSDANFVKKEQVNK